MSIYQKMILNVWHLLNITASRQDYLIGLKIRSLHFFLQSKNITVLMVLCFVIIKNM